MFKKSQGFAGMHLRENFHDIYSKFDKAAEAAHAASAKAQQSGSKVDHAAAAKAHHLASNLARQGEMDSSADFHKINAKTHEDLSK